MKIRAYEPQDLPRIYAVEEACFSGEMRWSREFLRQLADGDHCIALIAEERKQVAGFAMVELINQGKGLSAYLTTIDVAPESRRRGVATALLVESEARAAAAGARSMQLHVSVANEGAIRLYERHGYITRGREEQFYGEQGDALVLAKPLTSVERVVAHARGSTGKKQKAG